MLLPLTGVLVAPGQAVAVALFRAAYMGRGMGSAREYSGGQRITPSAWETLLVLRPFRRALPLDGIPGSGYGVRNGGFTTLTVFRTARRKAGMHSIHELDGGYNSECMADRGKLAPPPPSGFEEERWQRPTLSRVLLCAPTCSFLPAVRRAACIAKLPFRTQDPLSGLPST